MMEVINIGLIDPTQFDPNSKYYDPKSSKENPRWDCAKLKYIGKFKAKLTLEEIKKKFTIDEISLIRKGNRLSIVPVKDETAIKLLEILGKAIL